MASLNKAQIIGHLGADPEIRYMPSGDAVCNFSVATSEVWKDKTSGDKKEETTWHRISAFGKLAEICGQYLKKGSLAYFEGRIKTSKYTDKNGVEKYSTDIKLDTMKMLGGKQEGDAPARDEAPDRAPAAARAPSGFEDFESDIPF